MNFTKRALVLPAFFYVLSFAAFTDFLEIDKLVEGWDDLSFVCLAEHVTAPIPVYVSIRHKYARDIILRTENQIFEDLVVDLVTQKAQVDRSELFRGNRLGLTLNEILALRDFLHENLNHEIEFSQKLGQVKVFKKTFGSRCVRQYLASGKSISDAIRQLPYFNQRVEKVAQQALEIYSKIPARSMLPSR